MAAEIDPTKVLSEIRDCITETHCLTKLPPSRRTQRDFERQYERERELQRFAIDTFAAMNGWKRTDSTFAANDIGRCNTRDYYSHPHCLFDHVLWFKKGRRNAAIVAQPYKFRATVEECIEAARKYAEHLELAFHVPSNPFASIWYPGSTLFLVFTELGEPVHWLPEQENPGNRHSEQWDCHGDEAPGADDMNTAQEAAE